MIVMATTQTDDGRTADGRPSLKRVMGPGLLLLFIVGDILGTGMYALTGDVAAEVGGAAWLPFLVAFLIATVTAFSYLELVTKYPQAAGAALYTHKAFGIHFVTFLVAFVVMCSGITSASTASRAFAANFVNGVRPRLGDGRHRRASRWSSWRWSPLSTCAASARASSSTWCSPSSRSAACCW